MDEFTSMLSPDERIIGMGDDGSDYAAFEQDQRRMLEHAESIIDRLLETASINSGEATLLRWFVR